MCIFKQNTEILNIWPSDNHISLMIEFMEILILFYFYFLN